MKRKMLILAVITALCLCGCGKKEADGNTQIAVIEDYPAPDYEYQLFQSDDVILGEVTERLDSWFTNPDGKIKELDNALLTPYKVKVEKSYKGLFAEGETIIVDVWNGASVNSKSEIVPVTGAKSFYLRKGQRGVFMLEETKFVKSKDNETMYNVVYEDEGFFEPNGTNEEGKEIYASPSFEITLDQIPGDIKKVREDRGEKEKETDENTLAGEIELPPEPIDDGKDTIVALVDYPAPDYEYQLYESEDVIIGEVVEVLETRYTNPNREIEGVENAELTPYKVKVKKSYKGLLNEGDIITVESRCKYGIYPEDEEKFHYESNEKVLYLRKGQRGVFQLRTTEDLKTEDNETMYNVVMIDEGFFEPKGTNEEGKWIYASPSFEITLDRIPLDIKKADKHHGEDVWMEEFPAEPDRIIVGYNGVEKELEAGREKFGKVFSGIEDRVKTDKIPGTLKLSEYDAETEEHLSVGKSETYVEFIYDEVSTQWYDTAEAGEEGLYEKEIEPRRLFFPLSGQYSDCVFVGQDSEYKLSTTLGPLKDNKDLINLVQGFFLEDDATEQNP